ncbi:RNA-binding protein cabeza [Bienertia sinuspersici]
MVEGKEGDWECNGCKNRNYAFRSFCNRCKNPRLLVDTKTPPNSKWLPRIGDWICTGLSLSLSPSTILLINAISDSSDVNLISAG